MNYKPLALYLLLLLVLMVEQFVVLACFYFLVFGGVLG